MKTTWNVRQPQNIKCWISQEPLIGSSSTFKFLLRRPTQTLLWKTTSAYWKLNISATDDRIFILKLRCPPMEDKLKILKVEYLRHHWSDFPQILNLQKGDQTKIGNEDNVQWKMLSKYSNLNISATTDWIFLKF
jgi:hypothetical protein